MQQNQFIARDSIHVNFFASEQHNCFGKSYELKNESLKRVSDFF